MKTRATVPGLSLLLALHKLFERFFHSGAKGRSVDASMLLVLGVAVFIGKGVRSKKRWGGQLRCLAGGSAVGARRQIEGLGFLVPAFPDQLIESHTD